MANVSILAKPTEDAARAEPPSSVPATNEELSAAEADQLFRPEAVAYAERRLQGEVILAIPLSLRVWGCLLAASLMGAFIFAASATYSRKETVTGWIQPSGGLIRAVSLQPGIIQSINVKEGDYVSAGKPLAKVLLRHDVDEGPSGAAVQQRLEAEIAAADEQLAAGLQQIEFKRQELLGKRLDLRVALSDAQERLSMADERQKLAEIDDRRSQELGKQGALSAQRVESSRISILAMATATSSARSLVKQIENAIEDNEHSIERISGEVADLKARIKLATAQIQERMTSNTLQSGYLATTPISGQVLAIPVETGQTIPPGGTVAVISPTGSNLVGEIYVPSRAAGFIRKGQSVNVMYEAFPHERFGLAKGKVAAISHTVLGPAELAIPGLQMKEPVFRVRIELEKQDVDAYGEVIPLQPGMLLKADIVIDKRSLLDWILDPLLAIRSR